MRFVAESFWAGQERVEITATVRRIRRISVTRPASEGPVRLIRCLLSPTDELCSWLFEGSSEAAVRALALEAGLDLERVSPAVELWPPERPRPAP